MQMWLFIIHSFIICVVFKSSHNDITHFFLIRWIFNLGHVIISEPIGKNKGRIYGKWQQIKETEVLQW